MRTHSHRSWDRGRDLAAAVAPPGPRCDLAPPPPTGRRRTALSLYKQQKEPVLKIAMGHVLHGELVARGWDFRGQQQDELL